MFPPAKSDRDCTRIDFDAWLKYLPRRNRRIAQSLAVGNSTTDVAERFDLSKGRVSQLRRELKAAWDEFTGEDDTRTPPADPA